MKNYFKIAIIFLLLNQLSGCADLSENMITDAVADNQFASAQGIEEALIGAYVPFRWYYGRENGMLMTLYGTDLFRIGQTYNGAWDRYDAGLNPSLLLATQNQPIIAFGNTKSTHYLGTFLQRNKQCQYSNKPCQ